MASYTKAIPLSGLRRLMTRRSISSLRTHRTTSERPIGTNFESQEAYISWSMEWVEQAARVLKPSGSMYVCGFSEILADLKHPASKHFASCRWLVWHYRNKANLGKDWGRSHESLLHLRKSKSFRLNVDAVRIPYGSHTLRYPAHPQAASSNFDRGEKREHWTPHPMGAKPKDVLEIPTTCNGVW